MNLEMIRPAAPRSSPRRSSETDAEDLGAGVRGAGATRCASGCVSLVADAGEVCSCDLLEPLGKSQPTVSHHTKVLAEAG